VKRYLIQGLKPNGDDLYLIPWRTGKLIKFSLPDKTFSFAEESAPGEHGEYLQLRTESTEGIIRQTEDGRVYAFSPETGSIRSVLIDPRESSGEGFPWREAGYPAWEAHAGATLEAYLDGLAAGQPVEPLERSVSGIANPDGSAGKKIYEFCKREALSF
jgi:hypothetical protein